MTEPSVTIIGNVGTEPQLRPTDNGVPKCTFRVAQTSRRIVDGAWSDVHTSWFAVTCWRGMAENVLASVRKGDPVVVTGRLKVRDWSTDDRAGTSADIDATSVGHDLARGRASFSRSARRPQAAPTPQEQEAAAMVDELLEQETTGQEDPFGQRAVA